MLGGALLGCVLMALMMANAGGAWDNAKKYVEKGNLGGKGTDVHAATVVGDTVGDPFKDTSGPAMNILDQCNGNCKFSYCAVIVKRYSIGPALLVGLINSISASKKPYGKWQ